MKSQKRQMPIPSREITEEGKEIKRISSTSGGRGKKRTSAHYTENYVAREHIFRFHKFVGESVHVARRDLVNFKARHRKQNQRNPDHHCARALPRAGPGPTRLSGGSHVPHSSAARLPAPHGRALSGGRAATYGPLLAQAQPSGTRAARTGKGRARPQLRKRVRAPHRRCGRKRTMRSPRGGTCAVSPCSSSSCPLSTRRSFSMAGPDRSAALPEMAGSASLQNGGWAHARSMEKEGMEWCGGRVGLCACGFPACFGTCLFQYVH